MIYDTTASSVRSCGCPGCPGVVYGAYGDLCFSCEESECVDSDYCQREDE